MNGKIKTINSRGFGFITTGKVGNEIDFFFHYTAFNGQWKKLVAQFVANPSKELPVEFDIDPSATEAPRAVNVRLL